MIATKRKTRVRPMRRVETILEIDQPGDFAWYTVDGRGDVTGRPSRGERPTHLWFAATDKSLRRVCIAPYVGEKGSTHEWDGDIERPTLGRPLELRDDMGLRIWRGRIAKGEMIDG